MKASKGIFLKNSRRGLQVLLKSPLSSLELIQFEKSLSKSPLTKFKGIILVGTMAMLRLLVLNGQLALLWAARSY